MSIDCSGSWVFVQTECRPLFPPALFISHLAFNLSAERIYPILSQFFQQIVFNLLHQTCNSSSVPIAENEWYSTRSMPGPSVISCSCNQRFQKSLYQQLEFLELLFQIFEMSFGRSNDTTVLIIFLSPLISHASVWPAWCGCNLFQHGFLLGSFLSSSATVTSGELWFIHFV